MTRHKFVSLEEDRGARMRDVEFEEAYRTRRRVQEIALAIRSARESAGLSQAQLAALVGMKQPAIARLETSQGMHEPRFSLLDRIFGALGKQLTLGLGLEPSVRVETRRPRAPKRERLTDARR